MINGLFLKKKNLSEVCEYKSVNRYTVTNLIKKSNEIALYNVQHYNNGYLKAKKKMFQKYDLVRSCHLRRCMFYNKYL